MIPDAEQFARGYVRALAATVERLDLDNVGLIVEALWTAYQNDRQIFVFGNGGSAATASHLVNDLTKGALGHQGDALARPVRALSLTDNVPLLTAWANDVGYDSVFVGQLRAYFKVSDVVIAISASGNSENVCRAARYARETGGTVIALTGFGGGALASLAHLSVVVDSDHYGIVEDVHLQIGHILCYYFRQSIACEIRG